MIDVKNLPEKKYAQKTNLAPLGGSFNFVVCMIGTAMVATGHSFSLTTPYIGIVLDIILGGWAACAALCLFNSSAIRNATSFVDLGRRVFGTSTFFQKFLNFFFILVPVIINNIGALAAYITISSTAVQGYVPNIHPDIIQIFFTILIAVLGSVKSYDNSKFISVVTFCIFMVVAVTSASESILLMTQMPFFPQREMNFLNFITAIPILAFAMNGHPPLIGMAGEMTTENQKKFGVYMVVSQFIVVAINCTVGFFPALLLGECTQGDSVANLFCMHIETYGSKSTLILLAQIGLGFALIVQAPLFVLPLKELVLDFGGKTVRDRSLFLNIISSCVIALISGILGILLGNITDTLNVAATVGSLLMLGPTAAILSFATEKTTFAKVRAYILMIGGIIFLGINFFVIYETYNPRIMPVEYCPCLAS